MTMPADDADLERQPADSEYQTICGWVTTYGWLNTAMAERVRQLLHRQQAQISALSATPNIVGCVARLNADGSLEHETIWRETADEHLKRDALMQAVIDAARALRDCALRQHGDCEHTQAVADALDQAQAAQPEGERG